MTISIYADLGNLRHTEFVVIREEGEDVYSCPLKIAKRRDDIPSTAREDSLQLKKKKKSQKHVT